MLPISIGWSLQHLYLDQVLGVSHIIVPQKPGSSLRLEEDWRLVGDQSRAQWLVYIPEPMSGPLRALYDRILSALGEGMVLELRGSGSEEGLKSLLENKSPRSGLVFGRQWADQLGLGEMECGSEASFAGMRWRRTYALSEMLGTSSAVVRKKRETWRHIKGWQT